MRKNPNWARDELILALDLYMRLKHGVAGASEQAEVEGLSRLLNDLPIHGIRAEAERFRNANSVRMKLANFRRFDPDYDGQGLSRGGRLEEGVWHDFAGDPARLSQTARAIERSYRTVTYDQAASAEDDYSASEGRILTAVHRRRERDVRLSKRKKEAVRQAEGRLKCEVCDLDFVERYGDGGEAAAECHHRAPLSQLERPTATRISDLALLCANCHRVIHGRDPLPSVEDLKTDYTARNTSPA